METNCPECSSDMIEKLEGEEKLCEECGRVFVPGEEDCTPFGIEDTGAEEEGSWLEDKFHLKQKLTPNDADEVNAIRGFMRLEEISQNLELPDEIKIRAADIFRRAAQEELTRGRTISCIAGVSIYIAARQISFPITLDFMANVTGENKKPLHKAYRAVVKALELNLEEMTVFDYMDSITTRLNLTRPISERAAGMLKIALKNLNTSGKMKLGYAGAAVYLAAKDSGKRVTLRGLASALHTTDMTLCRRLRELRGAGIET